MIINYHRNWKKNNIQYGFLFLQEEKILVSLKYLALKAKN